MMADGDGWRTARTVAMADDDNSDDKGLTVDNGGVDDSGRCEATADKARLNKQHSTIALAQQQQQQLMLLLLQRKQRGNGSSMGEVE
jgi:hypothetical protein